jgi:hypothetical protein
MNLELQKISNWAQNIQIKFIENKSKTLLLSRRRKERKKVELYANNRIIEQVNTIKYRAGNTTKVFNSSLLL